jgi:hypothetical protein
MSAKVSYGQLDEMLRSLGFSSRTTEDNARVYWHQVTGAWILLPVLPPEDEVLPRHLVCVRTTLEQFGILPDPLDPAG